MQGGRTAWMTWLGGREGCSDDEGGDGEVLDSQAGEGSRYNTTVDLLNRGMDTKSLISAQNGHFYSTDSSVNNFGT